MSKQKQAEGQNEADFRLKKAYLRVYQRVMVGKMRFSQPCCGVCAENRLMACESNITFFSIAVLEMRGDFCWR